MDTEDPTVIIQARMEASRFPNKVVHPILGQPMILWQLDRLMQVIDREQLILALPDTPANHETLAPLLQRHGYNVQIPPGVAPDDVLGRFAAVCKGFPPSRWVVRLTGDCPLIEPDLIDDMLTYATNHVDLDYIGTAGEWPEGVADIDFFRARALLYADKEADTPPDREHVAPYIWRQPDVFKQHNMPCPFNMSTYCMSVDTPTDLRYVEQILATMHSRHGKYFDWRDIMTFMANHHVARAWATRRERNTAFLKQMTGGADMKLNWDDIRYPNNGQARKNKDLN